MHDTIKNNIISFNKFDEEKYSKIITVCELIKDFLIIFKIEMKILLILLIKI